jgi:hypothetical protein
VSAAWILVVYLLGAKMTIDYPTQEECLESAEHWNGRRVYPPTPDQPVISAECVRGTDTSTGAA